MEDADLCRMKGWKVGQRLVGDEGYGPTTIEITAIGERNILAKAVGAPRGDDIGSENLWSLAHRDWQPVDTAQQSIFNGGQLRAVESGASPVRIVTDAKQTSAADFDLIDALNDKISGLRTQLEAAAAVRVIDDERLAAAGVQCGCDTPDAMADEFERLRADYMMLARHMCPDMPEDELSSRIPEQIIDWSLQRRQAESAAIKSASLKAAADLLDAGFDRGILKKQDQCAHGRFGWEDCELCASVAIRALAATETTKTGGSA